MRADGLGLWPARNQIWHRPERAVRNFLPRASTSEVRLNLRSSLLRTEMKPFRYNPTARSSINAGRLSGAITRLRIENAYALPIPSEGAMHPL
jgi:hypothetical protein